MLGTMTAYRGLFYSRLLISISTLKKRIQDGSLTVF